MRRSRDRSRPRRRYNALAKATNLLLQRALAFWRDVPADHPEGFDEVGAAGMRLPAITVTDADLKRALRDLVDLEKSKQRVCPQGLTARWVITKRGYKMSVCVRAAAEGEDALHAAKTDVTGMPTIMKVPGHDGQMFLATHGAPGKTSDGKKLDHIHHPLQYLEDDIHAVTKDPESDRLGHSPEEAYHHAMRHHVVRDSGGGVFGVLSVVKRDERGEPLEWVLHRTREHQSSRRVALRQTGDTRRIRGPGLTLRAAEVAFLREHPPQVGDLRAPDGRVFARYQRIALPPLDADGKPIAGRPPKVRYDVQSDPSIYGGREQYDQLKVNPYWQKTLDEPKADALFRRYVEQSRRRLFPREADRPVAGPVKELLDKHGGDVEALLRSGELGHETVAVDGQGRYKVRRLGARKPLDDRETLYLVSRWRGQHAGLVETIKRQAQSKFPLLNDDAAMDDALDDGIAAAIHRFDPSRGSDLSWYVMHTARGHLFRAAQERGAVHGAEQVASGPRPAKNTRRGPDRGEDDEVEANEPEAGEGEGESDEDGGESPGEEHEDASAGGEGDKRAEVSTAKKQRKPSEEKRERVAGSQTEFGKVLEEALPKDERARTALGALYPTGDFHAGAHYKQAAAETGIPMSELLGYAAARDRVSRHPSYGRYYDRRLKAAIEARELERSTRGGDLDKRIEGEPSLSRTVEAIAEELRVSRLHKHLERRLPREPRGPRAPKERT